MKDKDAAVAEVVLRLAFRAVEERIKKLEKASVVTQELLKREVTI